MSSQAGEPNGLGGWLLLPILHLFIAVGFTAFNLAMIFTPDSMAGMTIIFQSGSDMAGLRAPIIISSVLGIVYIGIAGFAMIRLFNKSPLTPKTMIGFYVTGFVIALIELVLAYQIQEILGDETAAEAVQGVIQITVACCIWIPYFLVSVRVKNTFNPDTTEEIGRVFE